MFCLHHSEETEAHERNEMCRIKLTWRNNVKMKTKTPLCYSLLAFSSRGSSDIWHLRFHWHTENDRLWNLVQKKDYRLSPMRIYHRSDGRGLAQWSAADALVLKWCALLIDGKLPVHDRCEHRRGNGGDVSPVRRVREVLLSDDYGFVFRTDIRGYYRHIRKKQLWLQVSRFVTDKRILPLIRQYLWYCTENGGEFRTPEKGIPKGCSLCPLTGASLLYHTDCGFSHREGIYYARYLWTTFFYSPVHAGSCAGVLLSSMNPWMSAVLNRGPPDWRHGH